MAPLAIQQGSELQCTTEVLALTVLGDAESLRRAQINLVQNALEHSGSAGTIAIRVGRDHRVELANQGHRIPEDEREDFFKPFHRPQAHDHSASLGRNLVCEILRKRAAEITVTDEPGSGACFRIQFRRPSPCAAPTRRRAFTVTPPTLGFLGWQLLSAILRQPS